jgi:glycosyltransferase involved in cell wall biosynthesis
MRIGLLVDVYKPHVSGITNVVSQHKKALEAQGHKAFVFTLGNLDYEDEELRIIRSPAIPLSDTGYYLNFSFARTARNKCKTMDILHAQHPFVTGRIAVRYGKRYGIPVVYTNHTRYDLYVQHYLPLLPDALAHTFLETYLPSFTSQCDLVIAPSKGLHDVLRSYGVTSHIEIVPNGIDLEPFQNPRTRHPRAELGLPESAKVMIYVGRIAPEKNLAFLLRAFAVVSQELPETYLLLVGDGPEVDNLRDQAQKSGVGEKVIFTGRVEYEDVSGYLSMADAFVTASVTEVHPLSVIEAMAVGLPVLGIESPGVSDTVVDGVNGFVTRHDLAEFSLRMFRLMGENDVRARLAKKALEDSEQYSILSTSKRILGLYEELVAKYRERREREEPEKRLLPIIRK